MQILSYRLRSILQKSLNFDSSSIIVRDCISEEILISGAGDRGFESHRPRQERGEVKA